MPLQTDALSLVALSVINDAPPNSIQPRLIDGVHLRWIFDLSRGFPWRGFYLFRRPHRPSQPVCVGPTLNGLPVGTLAATSLSNAYGTWSSDANLVLTEAFNPGTQREVSIGGRAWLAFTLIPTNTSWRVNVRIGILASNAAVTLTAHSGDVEVAVKTVSGAPGTIVDAEILADAITSVKMSGTNAVVVDFCFNMVSLGAGSGWQRIPRFRYPMCLPVAHSDYPCPGKPPTKSAARALALNRITYGPSDPWNGAAFDEMYALLESLVVGGPASPLPMVDRGEPVISDEDSRLRMRNQRPLHLVVMGTLSPPVAQLLGLYFVDTEVTPGAVFDYLVVRDDTGVLGGNAATALSWISANPSFPGVDAWIEFNVAVSAAGVLAKPDEVDVFSLTGAAMKREEAGTVIDATRLAGLRWPVPVDKSGKLRRDAPVMYHLWRHFYGDEGEPIAPPMPLQYQVVTSAPLVLGRPLVPAVGEGPPDWPPFRLFAIDIAPNDGWFAYGVNAIDIFGRHSPVSSAARWFQWSPVPDPRPWYYQDPEGEREIHPYAVRLLDKSPPPAPPAVEAAVLDPMDNSFVRDGTYTDWRASLPVAIRETLVGLRVKWHWTAAQMRQAPDTEEFRLYFRSGHFNTLFGDVAGTGPAGAEETDVTTTIDGTGIANLAGATLRTEEGSFKVLSTMGDPLVVRVANRGPAKDIAPPPRGRCSIGFGSLVDHASYRDPNRATSYDERLLVVPADNFAREFVEPIERDGAPIGGNSATLSGGEMLLDSSPELAVVRTGLHSLALLDAAGMILEILDITHVDDVANRVTTATAPSVPLPARWIIGLRTRQYDVFLPQTGPATELLPPPTLADPVLYGQVGVTAADGRQHTADDLKWDGTTWGNRYGNEGRLGGPATVFRVRRPLPAPPPVVADTDLVYASPADYQGKSFHTFRWQPIAHTRAHVFRAVDNAVFEADWATRPRPPLSASDTAFFPDPAVEPAWDATKRAEIAAELNALNTVAPPTDHDTAMVAYRALSVDAVRVLGGLPLNERAFVRLTIAPLDPNDPAQANRRGPDDAATFSINPALRAFIDELDGRARNRYLYRAAYVDRAHNQSMLSLCWAPVHLRKVMAPRAPVIARANAVDATGASADEMITVIWMSNREPDLAEYRVYRTDVEGNARDLRLMALVHTAAVPPGPPEGRLPRVSFTNAPLPGGVTFHYRVVAVDAAGNISLPSAVVSARAFADPRPAPPNWGTPTIDPTTGAVDLVWTSSPPDLMALVERRAPGVGAWGRLGTWLPGGTTAYTDSDRDPGQTFEYRLRVMDGQGKLNRTFLTLVA